MAVMIIKRCSEDDNNNSQELGWTGIELEQSTSVGMRKLLCFSEIRQKEKRTGKEVNDWVFVFQS